MFGFMVAGFPCLAGIGSEIRLAGWNSKNMPASREFVLGKAERRLNGPAPWLTGKPQGTRAGEVRSGCRAREFVLVSECVEVAALTGNGEYAVAVKSGRRSRSALAFLKRTQGRATSGDWSNKTA
jgi:hypothetical protein